MGHTPQLNERSAFSDLKSHAGRLASQRVADLFEGNAQRATDFVARGAGLELDYSRQLLDAPALDALLALAEEADLPARAQALLSGESVNNTEDRPALHSLLRATVAPSGLEDSFREVVETRALMKSWATRINAGELKGFSGEVISDVVNIGIGGSDLGPRLVTEALAPFAGAVACHYVANVDPADLQSTLLKLNPQTTLFIICSKSFRTEETLTNALAAREWLRHAGADDTQLAQHFRAITTNLEAAADFGIPADNCLPMWDWVGGRYSVWSAVGLSCAIASGWETFADFLAGGEAMDRHFAEAAPRHNLPMLMSLLEVWNCNVLGAGNHVVLPYDQALSRLPDFLQQLTMESNGKRVGLDGRPLAEASGPVLWGAAGTMGQHSFHQLLHQGTLTCPADFILPLTTHTGMASQHSRLVANCLAQSRAMMVGRSETEARERLLARGVPADRAAELAPHLAMPGNRPNSIISMPALTPASLGALIALYEHRTYISGQLWGLNSFDQWGVELGKEIGVAIHATMTGEDGSGDMDPATRRHIEAWRKAGG